MRRIFWLGVGATVGVLVVRKVTKTAEAFTPAGIASQFGGLGELLRDFADDVRVAMADREQELLTALGVDADAPAVGRHSGGASTGSTSTPPDGPLGVRRH